MQNGRAGILVLRASPNQDGSWRRAGLNNLFISGTATLCANVAKVPVAAISLAAVRKPVHAARASAPPTLIRRTPSSASCATVVKSVLTRTLTGLGATAFTIADTSLIERTPGAYKQS